MRVKTVAFILSAGFLLASSASAFETVVVTSNADVVTTCSTLERATARCATRSSSATRTVKIS